MKTQGYEIAYLTKPGYPYMDRSTLVIKKTKMQPLLSFPIKITKIEKSQKAIYSLKELPQVLSEEENSKTHKEISSNLNQILKEKFEMINTLGETKKLTFEIIKKHISIEKIFIELLPLSNLPNFPNPNPNPKNPLFKIIYDVFVENSNYLETFLYFLCDDYLLTKNFSLEDFVEAIMFVAHQDILDYKQYKKFTRETEAMGLPRTLGIEDDRELSYETPLILHILHSSCSPKNKTSLDEYYGLSDEESFDIDSTFREIPQALLSSVNNEIIPNNEENFNEKSIPTEIKTTPPQMEQMPEHTLSISEWQQMKN